VNTINSATAQSKPLENFGREAIPEVGPIPIPSFTLAGKTALVTGGSRGIGFASAAALASAGAHVVIAARTPEHVESAGREISEFYGSAEPMVLDVTDLKSCKKNLDDAPPFDVLVNSAGMNRPGPFLQVTPEDFDLVMELNVKSTYFVSQYVARRMIEEKRQGSIIHISSQMGHVGAANRSVYCASKWAVEGITKSMAIELAPFGIRVNALAPTFIETPLTASFFKDEEFKREVLSKIKLGRLGKLDDIGGAILFLASSASALMTGASLLIDGGWTAD
jgi:NAD(P)-dependent dehydrogenase (short-subunit alcohol dehydrogenase family)